MKGSVKRRGIGQEVKGLFQDSEWLRVSFGIRFRIDQIHVILALGRLQFGAWHVEDGDQQEDQQDHRGEDQTKDLANSEQPKAIHTPKS